jgi:hypothetical protein
MTQRARGGRLLLLLAFVGVVATVAVVAVLSARGKLPPEVSKLVQFGDGGLSLGLDDDQAPDAASSGDAWVPPMPYGKPQTKPLSSAQLGAPLVHGSFVVACGAPATMKIKATVTVKMGHAVAVTVKTDPADKTIASCVDHAIRALTWDPSVRAGTVTVSY